MRFAASLSTAPAGERVAPGNVPQANEIGVGGMDRGAVPERQRADLGVGRQIAAGAGRFKQIERNVYVAGVMFQQRETRDERDRSSRRRRG